jgi:hypothetical protein
VDRAEHDPPNAAMMWVMTESDLHAEADRIFGPCLIEGCPDSVWAAESQDED